MLLRTKVVLLYIIITILAAGLCWRIYQSSNEIDHAFSAFVDEDIQTLDHLFSVRANLSEHERLLYEYYATTQRTSALVRLALVRRILEDDLDFLRDKFISNTHFQVLELVSVGFSEEFERLDVILKNPVTDWDAARASLIRLSEHGHKATAALDQLFQVVSTRSERTQDRVGERLEEVTVLVVSFVVVVLVLALTVGYSMREMLRADAARRRLAYFPERNPDPVFSLTLDGEVSYTNPSCHRLAARIDENLPTVLPPDIKHRIQNLLSSDSRYQCYEYMLSDHVLTATLQLLPDLGLCHVYISDITEQWQTEELLRKSEEKFSKAFYNIPDAVIIARFRDGMVLSANPAITTITGHEVKEVVGKTVDALEFWANPEEKKSFISAMEKAGEVTGFEITHRRKDGNKFPALLSASRLEIDGEQCLVTILHDLSEAKKAEHERLQLEQQLFRSQKMEAIGQLTAGIAHDFNNILAAILGYTELSLNRSVKDNDDKLIKYLGEIQKGGERGREMIKQMLTYSRTSPSKTSQESLLPLIKEAVQLIQPALSNGTTVNMELPEDLPEVNVDPVQVVQIILNLCINARDAMEESAGSIDIKMFLSSIKGEECDSCHAVIAGDYLVVSVKDSGSGIPDEIKAHIFDPFYTTKAVDKGTGMGLSMVHGIMHNFGGHIRVSSTPEEGTSFNLFFPVAISKDTKEPRSETLENAEYNRHAVTSGFA